jgi:hypothetical protein
MGEDAAQLLLVEGAGLSLRGLLFLLLHQLD